MKITKRTTPSEVLIELKKIEQYVDERQYGLRKKNHKKLVSRFVKDCAILSESHYTVGENEVIVHCTKNVLNIKGREYADLGWGVLVPTDYGTYIVPNKDGLGDLIGYFEYTVHSVERIRERLGKDFMTFFKEDYIGKNGTGYHLVKYDRNNDENEYICHMGDAFLIAELELVPGYGQRVSIKTVLSNDDLYANQLKDKLESKVKEEKYMDGLFKLYDNVGTARKKEMIAKGYLNKIA